MKSLKRCKRSSLYCQKHYPEKTIVLNPIATKRRDYAYWSGGRFEGHRTFVENLLRFCSEGLGLKVVTRSNGICVPEGVLPRKHLSRIIFHPESSREGKNWPKEKYLALKSKLEKKGFEPLLLLTQEERVRWGIEAPDLPTLSDMARMVCESGYMIGNDSGIGHLASCLGLPTVTICRSRQASQFWRPAWAPGKVVTPSAWIPNLKGLRWRDKQWKRWISVRRVIQAFQAVVIPNVTQESGLGHVKAPGFDDRK